MSNYKQKHKAPIRCRMRSKILYRPSEFNYCGIGCYKRNHHCINCVENISEILRDEFVKELKPRADERRIDYIKKENGVIG